MIQSLLMVLSVLVSPSHAAAPSCFGNISAAFAKLPRAEFTADPGESPKKLVRAYSLNFSVLTARAEKQFATQDACTKWRTAQEVTTSIANYRTNIANLMAPDMSHQALEMFLNDSNLETLVVCTLNAFNSRPSQPPEFAAMSCNLNPAEIDFLMQMMELGPSDFSQPCQSASDSEKAALVESLHGFFALVRANLQKYFDVRYDSESKLFAGTGVDFNQTLATWKARTSPQPAGCSAQAPTYPAVAAATAKARLGEGWGTLFYAAADAASSSVYEVTALHVPAEEGSYFPLGNLQPITTVDNANPGTTIQFSVTSLFDFGNDTVAAVAPRGGIQPLPLIGDSARPRLDQVFYLSGFPAGYGVTNETVTTLRCYFKGYGNNLNTGTAYALYCPDALYPINGLSGGAMTDEQGRVWGSTHAAIAFANMIFASPVSQDTSGKLVMGFSQTFESEHCLDSDKYFQESTCTVSSGSHQTFPQK